MKLSSYAILLVSALSLLVGCRYRPKDATIFKVEGKREFDHAYLIFPENIENRKPLKLKFMDTNAFTTTATLGAGDYILSLRTNEGNHFNQPVKIEPGKWSYEIPEPSLNVAHQKQEKGPAFSGRLYVGAGAMPTEVAVLFISHDVVMRRVPVSNERFNTMAPAADSFRVEVHALGKPPRSWIAPNLDLRSPKDVGIITIQ